MAAAFSRMVWLLLTLVVGSAAMPASSAFGFSDEQVEFPSLDGTSLLGHLLRPESGVPRPAVVMLHGCSGLGKDGRIFGLYRSWSRILLDAGYVVLIVDSATSRGFGQTCTGGPPTHAMLTRRPKDAYGALAYLQSQPFVDAARVALMGWSQGGAVVLLSIPQHSSGRPAPPPPHDFRAAVAFYPGSCSDRLQSEPYVAGVAPQSWTTRIPLLVLQGEADNWTPAEPCRDFIMAAKTRGARVEFQLYPDAVHAFDEPGVAVHERPEYRTRNGAAPLVGTNPAARAEAIARVRDFLRQEFTN